MRAERKRICRGVGIIFLLLCLTACSGGGEGEHSVDSQEPGYVSTVSRVDLKNMMVHNVSLCGEELVCEILPMLENGSFGRSEYYILPILESDAELKKLDLQFPDGLGIIIDLKKGADGNYYTLEADNDFVTAVSEEGVGTFGSCVCVYNAEGELLNKWGISKWLLEAGAGTDVHSLALDGEGNIYVEGTTALLMMSSAGQYQGCILERSFHMTCGTDGQVCYTVSAPDGYQIKKIDFATAKSEAVCSNNPPENGMFPGEDGEWWVFNAYGVYRSREGEPKPEQIFSWLEADVDGTMVRDMILLSDGRLLAMTFDSMQGLFAKTPEETPPLELVYIAKMEEGAARKETVTVAVMSSSWDMLAATAQYNREHADYRVVLKEYGGTDGYNDREGAVAAMDLDLASGRELDIISVDYFELEKYASKGILEDLSVYLDNGDGLCREDLVETVADAFTLNGKLIALPTGFRIETIIGRQSMLGDRDCWSIADMAAFYEEYWDSQLMQSASPQNMLEICMKFNQSYFMDWENGVCDFDRDEFYQLLEFAGRFGGKGIAYGYPLGCVRQEDGETLLMETKCAEAYFTSSMPQWFSGEEVNYIGYPTLDGKPGILLETSSASYGILSSSAHKEQAWDYLEYLIRSRGGLGSHSFVFPVLQDKLDQVLEESMEEPYEKDRQEGTLVLDKEGNPRRRVLVTEVYSNRAGGIDMEIYHYVPLPEEIDKVRELISLARPAPGYHEVVMDIIQEETAAYFAGDKDAKDVAALIQNRVQLYLNEQK